MESSVARLEEPARETDTYVATYTRARRAVSAGATAALGLLLGLPTFWANHAAGRDWGLQLVPLLVMAFFLACALYLWRRKAAIKPTPQAAALVAQTEARKREKADEWLKPWFVRYPLAFGVLWLLYESGQSPKGFNWVAVIMFSGLFIFLARELCLWLLVIGLAIGAFILIAHIPLSAAILVGAVIIAWGMKR